MSIEPVTRIVFSRLDPEQTAARLLEWLAGQGGRPNQVTPTDIECDFGSRSPTAFSGLVTASFSGEEKWPIKVLINITPGTGPPDPATPGGPTSGERPKFCLQCGTALPGEGRFCPGCGQPIPGLTEETPPAADAAAIGPAAQVSITIKDDIPRMFMVGQMARGPFKDKYQERMTVIANGLEQALATL